MKIQKAIQARIQFIQFLVRYVFENVSFSYDNEKPSLNNINLTIKKGETIALLDQLEVVKLHG